MYSGDLLVEREWGEDNNKLEESAHTVLSILGEDTR